MKKLIIFTYLDEPDDRQLKFANNMKEMYPISIEFKNIKELEKCGTFECDYLILDVPFSCIDFPED